MQPAETTLQATIFSTPLGWIALVGSENAARRVTIQTTETAARRAIAAQGESLVWRAAAGWRLAERLIAYAQGAADDFCDVELLAGPRTRFARRVVEACRAIPPGATRTYGQLAAAAGSPAAARAVGQVMARNPVPILVPCHRVLGAAGALGGFSLGTGLLLKRRLLDLEGAAVLA